MGFGFNLGGLQGQLGGLQQGGPDNWLAFANQLKSFFEGNFNLRDHAKWARGPDPGAVERFREQISQWAQPQQASGTPLGPPAQVPEATGNPAVPSTGQQPQRPMNNALAGLRQQFGSGGGGGSGNDLRSRLGIGF